MFVGMPLLKKLYFYTGGSVTVKVIKSQIILHGISIQHVTVCLPDQQLGFREARELTK